MNDKNEEHFTKKMMGAYKGVIHATINKDSIQPYVPYKVSYEDLFQPGLIELSKNIESMDRDELYEKFVNERKIISMLKSQKRKKE
jgi:hypothetical protein